MPAPFVQKPFRKKSSHGLICQKSESHDEEKQLLVLESAVSTVDHQVHRTGDCTALRSGISANGCVDFTERLAFNFSSFHDHSTADF